jgi:hypothetical protein
MTGTELGSVTLKRVGLFCFQFNTQHTHTSAVGGIHLPGSLSGPLRYHELESIKVSKVSEVARSGFLRFFNLYDKSQPEHQTKRGEMILFEQSRWNSRLFEKNRFPGPPQKLGPLSS